MKLLENFHGTKGITLNVQLVELLSILDEDISREEQDQKIIEYIQMIRETSEKYASLTGSNRYLVFVEDVINRVENITDEQRQTLKSIYMSSLRDLSVCNKQVMQTRLQENGLDPNLHTSNYKIYINFKAIHC